MKSVATVLAEFLSREVQRVPITAAQVIMQPDHNQDCGLYAMINLYRKMGLDPPARERFDELLRMPMSDGLTLPVGVLTLPATIEVLVKLAYPGTVLMGVMPKDADARSVFPPLVEAGFGIIACFSVEMEGRRHHHASVIERCEPEGMLVQCGVLGLNFVPYTTAAFDWEQHPDTMVMPVTYFQNCLWPFALWRGFVMVAPPKLPVARAIILTSATEGRIAL
jgi:hypothetical protein